MKPQFAYEIFRHTLQVPAMLSILAMTGVLSFLWTYLKYRKHLRFFPILFLSAATFAFSLLGARVFHAILERPQLFLTPRDLLFRFDGMVFYGSVIFGILTYLIGMRLIAPVEIRASVSDHAALLMAAGAGSGRLGCFLEGCCWGKISSVSWALAPMDSHSATPLLGIPRHPVQIYDSILAWMIFIILNLILRDPKKRGKGLGYFFVLYGASRFFTEFFRGDDFRGLYLSNALSTSQIISIIGIIIGLITLSPRLQKSLWQSLSFGNVTKVVVSTLAAVFLVGCKSIQEPPKSLVTISTFSMAHDIQQIRFVRTKKINRGVILILADDIASENFSGEIQKYFPGVEGTEQLFWWGTAKNLSKKYSHGLILQKSSATAASIKMAIAHYEQLHMIYDIYFMSHGFPNHYSTGYRTFFSWKDLGQFSDGQLRGLDLVYSQSCYGDTLVQDWFRVGAKNVISFGNENYNFFWIFSFLSQNEGSIEQQFLSANKQMVKTLKYNPAFRKTLAVLKLDYKNDPGITRPPMLFQSRFDK